MNSSIRIAAAVIRDRHDRILLVRKRGTTAFMQPGGKIHPNEDALGALARELHEELGCSIRPATARFLGRFAHGVLSPAPTDRGGKGKDDQSPERETRSASARARPAAARWSTSCATTVGYECSSKRSSGT
jgi:8-oxo-dGTP pyrophosphatase MutT (NUDIX family)